MATTGTLRTSIQNASGTTVSINPGIRVADNTWLQLVVSVGTPAGASRAPTTLYLDGVSVGTSTSVARASSAATYSFAYAKDSKWSLPSEPSITSLVKGSQMGQVTTYDMALTAERVATYCAASSS